MPRLQNGLLAASAIGETLLGIGVLTWPRQLAALLLGGPLGDDGVLLARCFGVAVIGVGLAWWFAKGTTRGCRESAPGYLVYNLGVGATIAFYALSAAGHVMLLWSIALLHLALGLAFAAAALPLQTGFRPTARR